MKGLKKQSDIDAGRAAINARAQEVKAHEDKTRALLADLGKAEKEEADAEKEVAKAMAREHSAALAPRPH